MDVRLFDGGRRVDGISPLDRGLAYGDGLFETMRAHHGDVPWWDRHWSRLRQGATVLGLALPDEARARAELAGLLDGRDGVTKLLVTRGAGERGYAPGPHEPFWMLSVSPTPPARSPITLRWCATRLALQPALAGLKHCNRLEQVLARAEWTPGETADEGLMLDAEGAVVSAVAGNLFVLRGDAWLTPSLDRCGVRGVMRGWALTALDATEARLATADVETADALFVCNAVRGILEVARLGDRTWTPHPQVAGLRARLAADHPAFASLTEMP
ncbi:aminodeoxychorismate lyase [Lysobacter xinjiangensis]|uniref:Aminodeoxychorismate lyase n=1 Tax=Cognatilysobacter xinjiangensis TaxID=546892 RepID=A0ABQ3BYK4_9GAMM|nr:aminodeoxychorismate lyase [Lysobacter xinjiangensis]GGZ61549.1 aminodeoxychorismate lyase [Lysobacter xinjiangensis]